jgi:hypothetical protein
MAKTDIPNNLSDEAKARLFETAQIDQNLKKRLLEDPAAVGKELGIVFEDSEVKRIKRAAAFLDLIDETRSGRIRIRRPIGYPAFPRGHPIFYPIFYPIGYPIINWEKNALLDLFKDLIVDVRLYENGAPELIKEIDAKLEKKMGLIR